MKIFTIAVGLATIVASTVAILQYCQQNKNVVKVPDNIINKKAGIELSAKLPIYAKENNWLLTMYETAKKIPYYDGQRDALIKTVKSAINIKDYNMAIMAADAIPYSDAKRTALMSIVKSAITNKDMIGYALIAAEKIPYYDDKALAMQQIVDAASKEAMPKAQSIDNAIKSK
jgi:hypothetical protein